MDNSIVLSKNEKQLKEKRGFSKTAKKVFEQKYLWILALPAIILILLFSYLPMVGVYMAFTDYTPTRYGFFHDLFNSPFVGLKWFEFFFRTDFVVVMRNTLAMSVLTLLFSFPAPIIIAICLNEVKNKHIKKGIQTTSYLPFFISWVIAANIFATMLSANGVVNHFLQLVGLTQEDILFFQEGRFFWWIIAFANTWKGMGYNAIIYLAAISGISPEQYEAADVDGATRWQKIWHITLPSLTPTIIVLLILAVGGILNTGFEQVLLLQNPSIFGYSDVLDTYAFRFGMQNGMWSYGAAVGLFKSVVSFILVIGANRIAGRLNGTRLF